VVSAVALLELLLFDDVSTIYLVERVHNVPRSVAIVVGVTAVIIVLDASLPDSGCLDGERDF
jgi:hypothetical protein